MTDDRIVQKLNDAMNALAMDVKEELTPIEKVEVRETDVSGELPRIVKFLLGEAKYDGYWFGDKPMDRRGEFWWRTKLREEFERLTRN